MLEDLLVRLCPLDEEGPEGSVTQGEKEGEREKEGAAVHAAEKEEVYRGGSRGAGVRIGAKERAALREACDRVLFDGIATGTGDSSVAGAVVEALKRCPREARPALARNIVVGGGTAAMRGFVGRLAATLGEAADLLARVDVELKERATQSDAGARGRGRRIPPPRASASCSMHHHLVDLVHPLRRARVYCGGAVYECHGSAGGEGGAGEGEEDTKGGAAEEDGGDAAAAERTGRQTGSQTGGGTESQTAPQLQPNCMPWIGASIVGSLDEPKPKAAPRGTRGGGNGGAGGGRDANHSEHRGFYIAKNTWMKSVEARGEGALPSRDMTSWALAGGGGGVQRA
jgi:actin-related protein